MALDSLPVAIFDFITFMAFMAPGFFMIAFMATGFFMTVFEAFIVFIGKVVRCANFGAFVTVTDPDSEAQADGLVHITQIRDGFVESVEDELSVGQEVQVR
eukprot:CAMPEP_0185912946 /NCGR_PEP_ID=MMETSP0196C-20130402/42835_1 /TAXON_ID=2932 /ORGANISM="Alexandrium fundyense, Strain CCMP1719" /LENGTH=100 /DNA_ID=CAMNT_0028634283 /DNA_START=415 /DNA_END=713 /DNA_ORIENTATION=+